MTDLGLTPISLASLPAVGRSAGLTDEDRALAKGIAAMATGGNAAVLPESFTEKAAATKYAAKVKRMVKAAGVVPAGKTGRARLVGSDASGYKVAVYFGDPGKAPAKPEKAPASK